MVVIEFFYIVSFFIVIFNMRGILKSKAWTTSLLNSAIIGTVILSVQAYSIPHISVLDQQIDKATNK